MARRSSSRPAGDGQTEQLQSGITVLAGNRVAVSEQRADLHATDTGLEVELDTEGLGDELLLGKMSQDLLGIEEDSVSAGRSLIRHSVLVQLLAEVGHLVDTCLQVLELCSLKQTLSQCVHVAAGHTAVSQEALVHDGEHLCLAHISLVTECYETADVDDGILLGRHGHIVCALIHLMDNLADGLVLIALLAGLDEVGVLGETCGVHKQLDTVFLTQSGYALDVLHGHGLSAGGVVGNGQHYARYLLAGSGLEHFLKLLQVHIALEGNLQLGIGGLLDGAVQSHGLAVLDMTLGGVEMRVAGEDVTLFYDA